MSFLHLSLLAGLALGAIPVALHLFGQRQPKQVDFPALRFVRKTKLEQNTSWQLRHVLLLLLRVLLVGAMVFALARPRVHSAAMGSVVGITALGICALLATIATVVALVGKRPKSVWSTAAVVSAALWLSAGWWGYQTLTKGPVVPTSDQTSPIATAIVIDNGPTMSYLQDGQTRLQASQEMAQWILEQMPVDSRVGVLSGTPVGSLALDPISAKTQVGLIESQGNGVDLLSRLRTALELVVADELERKEVYVLTDLMAPAWQVAQTELKQLLDQHSGEVLVQVIDLGDEDSVNWRLGNATSDFRAVPVGGDVTIDVAVSRPAEATGATVTAELWLQEIDASLPIVQDGQMKEAEFKAIDRQVVEFGQAITKQISLTARGLPEGANNLEIRLDKSDPLAIDNRRFVSIPSMALGRTLVVASDPEIGRLIEAVINFTVVDSADQSPVADQVQYVQLEQTNIEDFAVVCLYDPPRLTSGAAQKLINHVRRGGGLLQILGPQLGTAEVANQSPLAKLLPGKLKPTRNRPIGTRDAFFVPVAISHPIWAEFGESAKDTLWNELPIYQNWQFELTDSSAQVLIGISDGAGPAAISHVMGQGQIITFTTPLPEPDNGRRPLWNQLWATDNYISSFGLLLGTLRALSGAEQTGRTFAAGKIVHLTNDSSKWPSRYTLYDPTGATRRVDAGDEQLALGRFESAGFHYLRGQRGGKAALRTFSINVNDEDTDLTRIDSSDLDEKLGAGNYRLAANRDQLESSVGQARFGRELFPLLMILIAGLFLAEQAMSNRFYKINFGSKKRAA